MPRKSKDSQYETDGKQQAPTAHERRMYNQYAKHALSKGEDVENIDEWVAKRRKQEQEQP